MAGDFDPSISNGSCWAGVNVALDDAYIPCGNVADGNSYACCHYGDNCLSSNACFHARYGLTYLAGCTTQDFSGSGCQSKGIFVNQAWVGLTRCDPDTSTWAGCPEKGSVVGTNPPTTNCKCSKDAILFQDEPTLSSIASLPLSLGGTISWYPHHTPTTTNPPTHSDSVTTMTTTIPPIVSDAPPPTSSATTPPGSPSSGLSTGEKAGIGAGAGAGAIVLGILMAVMIKKWKAKREIAKNVHRTVSPAFPDPFEREPTLPNLSIMGGFKAELPADDPRAPSIAPASPVPSSHTQVTADSATAPRRQYIPYRPGVYAPTSRYSNISQVSSQTSGYPLSPMGPVSPVTPMSPPAPEQPQPQEEPHNEAEAGPYRHFVSPDPPGTIHELEA